jgi:hypothetical protein
VQQKSVAGKVVHVVCSSALLFPAILGCRKTISHLLPLSEFARPSLCKLNLPA